MADFLGLTVHSVVGRKSKANGGHGKDMCHDKLSTNGRYWVLIMPTHADQQKKTIGRVICRSLIRIRRQMASSFTPTKAWVLGTMLFC